MTDDKPSLLEWLTQEWRTPLWQRTVRLSAAVLLVVPGVLSLILDPESGNWLLLLVAAFVFLILGLRIHPPEAPLPVRLEETVRPREQEAGGAEPAAMEPAPEAAGPAALELASASAEPAAMESAFAAVAATAREKVPAAGAPVAPEPASGAFRTAAAESTPAMAAAAAPKQITGLAGLLPFLRLPIAFGFAVLAQYLLDVHPNATDVDAILPQGGVLYAVAAFFAVWGLLAGDFSLALNAGEPRSGGGIPITRQRLFLSVGAGVFGLLAYASFTGGMFHVLGLIVLFVALFYWALAVAQYEGGTFDALQSVARAVAARFRTLAGIFRKGINISPWSLLVIACFLALVFTRTYNMAAIPPVMTDDHNEKLVNVVDILEGRPYIFFANNGGREALEFYLIALLVRVAGTGISFLSLKIVSVAGGIALLPFVYLLGKELADRRVGLLAMILVGIGYWPDVLSRIGLRFPLSMLFTAATLYFFLRALRRRRWNDFLWAGVMLGIGMYGYTPIRIVPVALALATVLFLLHPSARGHRRWGVSGFLVTCLTAGLLFIPMLRFALEFPNDFWLRTVTRIVPETGDLFNPVSAFLQNMRDGVLMFNWNDGGGWFLCVPLRPALDVVTGALFSLGFVMMLAHFLHRRSWESLFLVLSPFILILPSVLALAEPVNNPSLARANAVVPVAFLLPAFGLAAIQDHLRGWIGGRDGVLAGAILAAALMIPIAAQNLDLTLVRYPIVYRGNAQNEVEVGGVMKGFAQSVGRYEDAYVIPYPYWVGDRGVNIYAGLPINAERTLQPENIGSFAFTGRPTLFLLLAEDVQSLESLRQKFPEAEWKIIPSAYPNKDFIAFLVPGAPGEEPQP